MRRTTRSASAAATAATASKAKSPSSTIKPPPSPLEKDEPGRKREAPSSSPTFEEEPGGATPARTPSAKKKPRGNASASPANPYPTWPRPTPEECWAVRDALAELHGDPAAILGATGPECSSGAAAGSVLGALVRTILSQNTTDATSARAYASLRQEFGGGAGDDTADDPEGAFWERVRTTAPGKLETSIRVGGLADIKAARIRAILDTLVKEAKDKQAGVGAAAAATGAAAPRHHHHYPSLEDLRRVPDDEEVKRQLTRFNGVGPKSAACVLMFALGRSDFAVDTHVLSMSATAPLRWVPASASREGAYEHLNARVPAECKVALHVLMVEHGKRCPSCARGGRLATTKAEGGWLATERGRWAAEALASGEVRCPLAAAVARARSGGGGEETEGVVAAGGGVVVPKKEEEQVAWGGGLVPKKEEEEEEQAW